MRWRNGRSIWWSVSSRLPEWPAIGQPWRRNVDAAGDLYIDRDFVVGCALHARLAIKTLAIGNCSARQHKDAHAIMAAVAMRMNHANIRPTDQPASWSTE